MDTIQTIGIAVSLVGYGICSACKDGAMWQRNNLKFDVWSGGNSKWIWTSDTWHTFKHLEQFFLYSGIFIATGLTWYWFFPFVIITSFILGRTFVLFYHTLLLKNPDQTLWEWAKGAWLWSHQK